MENFTPGSAALGGALIGLAASLLLFANGRIAGISGIVGGLLRPRSGDTGWRAAFMGGLLAGGALLLLMSPGVFTNTLERSPAALVVAGALVGFGTRLGNGCTSGHGVCGLSRLSPRSLAATLAFMAAGVVAATLVSRVFGGVL